MISERNNPILQQLFIVPLFGHHLVFGCLTFLRKTLRLFCLKYSYNLEKHIASMFFYLETFFYNPLAKKAGKGTPAHKMSKSGISFSFTSEISPAKYPFSKIQDWMSDDLLQCFLGMRRIRVKTHFHPNFSAKWESSDTSK